LSEGDKIRSVQGYFDQKTFVEQLGLQAIVVPSSVGPVTFRFSARVSTARVAKPGAFSLTWIEARSKEEEREVSERSRKIVATQISEMPGFLGWVGSVVGGRMFTATAWEDPGSAAQLLLGGLHQEAVNRFFGGGLGAAGFTSVWIPHHLNAMWVRCTACGRVTDFEQRGGRCE
jgi:hypothetical protein